MSSALQEPGGANGGPQPIIGDRGASILGPRNLPLETANRRT
jgi:hypothetical protein